jgi:NADH:ubiquinone oxidoreductase subunit F (NADH-binding)
VTVQTRPPALLPGIPVAGLHAAPPPHQLLERGTLLLSNATPGTTVGLDDHQRFWGPLPAAQLADLIAAAERTALAGAGGAGFPTARKLQSMVGTRTGPVMVNGSEGESASGKDTVLLTHVPHLVLDAAVMTARALDTRSVVVRIPAARSAVIDVVRAAIDERDDRGIRVTVSPGEDTFIAGEASAVISSLQGGAAAPTALGKPPTIRSGLRSRPVLLSNVETFARLAVAVRGHWDSSSLLTVSGAVTESGVLEVAASTALGHILQRTGADFDLAALITGGWHGTWLPANSTTLSASANRDALGSIGGHWGAGALIAIPKVPCPVEVLHAITGYLVAEGARQCAPCILGLDAAQQDLLTGAPVMDRVQGRGLCAHPTASIAAMRSGQVLLAEELAKHAAGRCGVREQGALT